MTSPRSAFVVCTLSIVCACADSATSPPLGIHRIDFAPVAAVLVEGDTIRFAAIPRDSTGRILPRTKAQWSSTRPEIATIDSLGLVRGVAAGRTVIRALVSKLAAETEVVVQPSASTSMRDIDAGAEHSCAVTSEAQVICWGGNTFGQLGDGVVAQSTSPIRVAGLSDIGAIATGNRHTCAMRSTSGVLCWGSNSAGQLGDTSTTRKVNSSPHPLLGQVRFRQLSAGSAHTCGVADDDRVYCWGSNALGQSDGQPGHAFHAVAAGHGHTCGLTLAAAVLCWGWNEHGQLGEQLATFRFRAITAGYAFTCGISVGGPTYCWGFDGDGQLGNGSLTGGAIPRAVQGPAFVQIDAGLYHACGITAAGDAYCWGRNVNGEVHPGSPVVVAAPVRAPVPALVLIRAGAGHSCGITVRGSFTCWGDAGDGRLGVR